MYRDVAVVQLCMVYCLAHLAAEKPACGLYVLLLFFIYFIFVMILFRPVTYLKIYQTNLCQIFRVGRTMAVDDQCEISILVLQGTLPWQPIFVGFIHRTDFRHASG